MRDAEQEKEKRPRVSEYNRRLADTVRRVAEWLETDPAVSAMVPDR